MAVFHRPENSPYRQQREILDKNQHQHQVEIFLCPSKLHSDIQQELVQELTPVTGRGFMRQDIYSQALGDDVAQHILAADRLIIAKNQNEVSAFLAASLRPLAQDLVYHLEGIIVEEDFQSTGLASRLLQQELEATQATVLAFHTQSTKMVALGEKFAHLNRATALQFADVIQTKNQKGVVDVGRYGGQPLYENVQKFAPLAISTLDWQNGDAQICAGRVRR